MTALNFCKMTNIRGQIKLEIDSKRLFSYFIKIWSQDGKRVAVKRFYEIMQEISLTIDYVKKENNKRASEMTVFIDPDDFGRGIG